MGEAARSPGHEVRQTHSLFLAAAKTTSVIMFLGRRRLSLGLTDPLDQLPVKVMEPLQVLPDIPTLRMLANTCLVISWARPWT